MKFQAWSLFELKTHLLEWKALEGYFLRDISPWGEDCFLLEFYLQGHLSYLVLDLRVKSYCILKLDQKLKKKAKTSSPSLLFFKAHFQGKLLREACILEPFGRVMEFQFADGYSFQIRLFPKDLNLMLVAGKKKVFLNKPKNLEAVSDNYIPSQVRSLEEMYVHWSQCLESGGAKKKKGLLGFQEKLDKEQSILQQMQLAFSEFQKDSWQRVIDEIQEKQESYDPSKDFPSEDSFEKNWHHWLECAYKKRKNSEEKREKLSQKIKDQELGIQELENMGEALYLKQEEKKWDVKNKGLQNAVVAKTRSKDLGVGLRFHIGKSAADNIKLLRRAKPWHHWFHLRDVPGSHGILECPRNYDLSQETAREAARELAVHCYKGKLSELVEVQYTQCRYVRPIKGDKLGRVYIQKEKVVLVRP